MEIIKKMSIKKVFEIDYPELNKLYHLYYHRKYATSITNTIHYKIAKINNGMTIEEMDEEDLEIFKVALKNGIVIPKREFREKVIQLFYEK